MIEQVVSGLTAGLTAAILIELVDWALRPRLKLYFKESDTYTEAPTPDGPVYLFIHLAVENIRKSMASECRVFLLKLEKRNNKKFENLNLKTHLPLKWANEVEPKGFGGLEIPGHHRRRVDLIHAPLDSQLDFLLFIEGGIRGIGNGFQNGEYRFTLQVVGGNTNTITKRFILKWEDNFIKENILVREEDIFRKIWFRISQMNFIYRYVQNT